MKIAMISMHTCPMAYEEGKETGGMNVYVMQLAKELVNKGHVVDIYTRLQSRRHRKIVQVNKNLRVVHVEAGPSQTPKKKLINFVSEFSKNVYTFILNEKLTYDVIHAHYYLSGLGAIELRDKYNLALPVVVNFHTLALMKNLVARSDLEREETNRINAELMLSQKADLLVASSESDKEYLTYLYGVDKNRVQLIYPGVDTKIFHPLSQKEAREKIDAAHDHKIVLFVGRIEPLKGIDALLYALKIILEKDKNKVCLFIVGGDVSQKVSQWSKELRKLNELKHILSLTTEVNFVGQKPQNLLPYYYNAADVVVMPSHYESFGMAALEAIACGTPVITTNVSGIATLIDKHYQKFVATANNPLLLAEQIENLLAHANLPEKKQLTESIHNFTWENMARRIEKIYEDVISNK